MNNETILINYPYPPSFSLPFFKTILGRFSFADRICVVNENIKAGNHFGGALPHGFFINSINAFLKSCRTLIENFNVSIKIEFTPVFINL